jgi:hypothetical protein
MIGFAAAGEGQDGAINAREAYAPDQNMDQREPQARGVAPVEAWC